MYFSDNPFYNGLDCLSIDLLQWQSVMKQHMCGLLGIIPVNEM